MSVLKAQDLQLVADVLVIGGGPAGCWAALSAMEQGASVVLAEKGYVGTSGPTASGNSSIINTAPGSKKREKILAQRETKGLGLVDVGTVDRVLDEVHFQLERLSQWGYGFPVTENGQSYRGSMRGADYLRFLRQRLIKGGVTVLDQAPALELLVSADGVAGARGVSRLDGSAWTVRSAATVIAAGGCAFLSGALGTNNLTGDSYLLAVEAGAQLSGMDFTGQYGVAPIHTSVTKGIIYNWASFFDEAGERIEAKGERQDVVASGLLRGRVYAQLDKADAWVQSGMRGQANVFMPFDRQGIDPFTQKFEVNLLYEGTVRGTGGILVDADLAAGVPGLYAAGDAATREFMAGASSGGGGPNSSWALATGIWSGRNAAAFARKAGPTHAERPARSAAPHAPRALSAGPDTAAIISAVQAETLPLDRSFYRRGEQLDASYDLLGSAWSAALDRQYQVAPIKARETLALVATARWINASARQRRESRGIHRRLDLPQTDAAQAHRILSGGLDSVWAHPHQAERAEVAS